MKPHVVITTAADMNFRTDYVALPKNYGTPAYFERSDIKEIYRTIYRNLDLLDKETGFSKKFASCERLFLKPNLVSVYHKSGMMDIDYPESTDPRVFDAIVSYMKQFQKNIVITESSGKPMPTRNSFKVSGFDRIAKYHKTGLVALETCPVVRYMLPKAEVMKEVYIPEIYKDIIGGEGNTPAPVDPVDTHVIISGTDPVGTDKIATRVMGIDPDTIPLMTWKMRLKMCKDQLAMTKLKY